MEARARSATQQHLQHSRALTHDIDTCLTDDTQSVFSYLEDYRRYHPLRGALGASTAVTAPAGHGSVEDGTASLSSTGAGGGGYSGLELQEIGELVAAQLTEMQAMCRGWEQSLEALKRRQDTAAALLAELVKRSEVMAQSISMAQGLGPVYGAPRRRAMERLRHIDAVNDAAERDIDVQLERVLSACRTLCISSESALPSQDTSLAPLDEVWSLVTHAAQALFDRCVYLDVLDRYPVAMDVLRIHLSGHTDPVPTTTSTATSPLVRLREGRQLQ